MDFLVHHLLQTSAERFPAKAALVHGAQRLTYAELVGQATALAHGLARAGVQRGDRVAIFLGQSIAQVVAIFGVLQAGAICVPMGEGLFPQQVSHIAHDCGIRALITDEGKFARVSTSIEAVPSLAFVVLAGSEELPTLPLKTYTLQQLGACSPPEPWCDRTIDQDLALILYTSGSTGKPKGVMLTHANVCNAAALVATQLAITAEDRILAALAFNYDAGFNQLTTALRQGSTLVLLNFVFAREVVQALRNEAITGLVGVPTLWSLLTQPTSTLHKQHLPHLRYISCAGGTLPQPVLARLRTLLPTTAIFIRYGQTEAFLSTILPPDAVATHPTSMGKALPNVELWVLDEQGQLCQPGEVGELVHRGPILSPGYWGQPELTARVFRPNPFLSPACGRAERVCYSGDLVKRDEEGFFYFVGRRDAMIKSAGYRISPTEIEEVLFQSGQLRHAAVIGVPDEVLGQRIKAYVAPRDGESVDPDGLLAFCAERMPPYMLPKTVEVLDKLPITSNGKVDYPTLRKLAGF
ncbi:MAG: AMP-dependent synthetase [Caldilinea sp. CFX5]|nr:AMP-dependent synthetase [Caldilinea sp. CFX5]